MRCPGAVKTFELLWEKTGLDEVGCDLVGGCFTAEGLCALDHDLDNVIEKAAELWLDGCI